MLSGKSKAASHNDRQWKAANADLGIGADTKAEYAEYAKWLLGRSFACHFRQAVCRFVTPLMFPRSDPALGFHQSRSCTKSQQDLFLQPSRAQKNLELPVWSWMAQRFLSKQESFPHVTFKENNAHVVQCRRCQRAQMDCMEGSQLSKLWLQAIRNSLTAWYIILLYYLIYWETHQPNRS